MRAGKGRREGLAGGGSVLCPDAQMCPQKLTRLIKWGWLFACLPQTTLGSPFGHSSLSLNGMAETLQSSCGASTTPSQVVVGVLVWEELFSSLPGQLLLDRV